MDLRSRESGQSVATVEEESLKRTTDCVYFLASPLTCKKGNECEYRHSEAARMNPRDCWFWMNGNCLNKKCTFRHPPLDGLIGTPGAPSVGNSSMPPLQNVASHVPLGHAAAYSTDKQHIPCHYFQQGFCLKGDKCTFFHGLQPTNNPSSQQWTSIVPTIVSEPQNLTKTSMSLQKCTQQKVSVENAAKMVQVPLPPKQVLISETTEPKNGVVKRKIVPLNALDDECPKYIKSNVPSVAGGNSVPRFGHGRQAQAYDECFLQNCKPQHNHQAQAFDDHLPQNGKTKHSHQVQADDGFLQNGKPQPSRQAQAFNGRFFQNGKGADEFLRESSSGFDVHIDNGLREYESRRTASYDRRRLNSGNDFEHDHPVAKYDKEPYNDRSSYDSYGKMQDRLASRKRRVSSERTAERSSIPEKRGHHRVASLDQISESDLRHRLLKQRRVSDSRLAVGPNSHQDIHLKDARDRHVQDQGNRGQSRGDSHHTLHENSRNNRLHSRLTLPRRSSPDSNHHDPHLEREMDRGRNHARLSPGRHSISDHEGRNQDRNKWRDQEDFRGVLNRKDRVDSNASGFTGPKGFTELKSARVSEHSENQHGNVGQESEGSLSFEGPKPLSEILRRKREAKTSSSGNSTVSRTGEADSPRESGEIIPGSPGMSAVTETETVLGTKEESGSLNVDLVKAAENNDVPASDDHKDEYSDARRETELETEDATLVDDPMEDRDDLENFDYDQEQADGGEFENVDAEDYSDDDDDGDDFAKKIGVMFS